MFPSISANSPRLWVATAQPMSHSSVLSGGLICAATARAFSAHALALPTSAGRDTGGCPGVDGGFCCANEIDRLFTIACQNLWGYFKTVTHSKLLYGSLIGVTR